jgi:hypothetical protein
MYCREGDGREMLRLGQGASPPRCRREHGTLCHRLNPAGEAVMVECAPRTSQRRVNSCGAISAAKPFAQRHQTSNGRPSPVRCGSNFELVRTAPVAPSCLDDRGSQPAGRTLRDFTRSGPRG